MAAFLDRIVRCNPTLNAIVARREDEACLALADEADRAVASGAASGALHGLPIAFKDLEPATGFPWTRGCPFLRDAYPADDSILVQRLKHAGAVPIGKTNVPQFGMGSHTYNEVYGTTRNPYDVTKSAGGSSGGAAAAIAAGLLPIADGSDFGGSLRNPANFTNIVGFRPSFGLVPDAPNPLPSLGFGVKGPMARSVDDVSFLLAVMTGRYAESDLARDFAGVRVAWSPDLDGLPLDRRVRRVLDGQRRTFEDLGCRVEEACPDFSGVDDFFLTIRAARSWQTLAPLLAGHRDEIKPEAVAEIEAGSRWPHDIDGVRMEHYIAWMKSAYWISATFDPAISVPAGFTADGLPVGVQIAGRRGDDRGVLQLAYAFEQATGCGRRRPPLA
ncbi:MAG: amidase [Acidobacteria bacterium]|nr:MAG: amidase [Acidobacteriota bacterium]